MDAEENPIQTSRDDLRVMAFIGGHLSGMASSSARSVISAASNGYDFITSDLAGGWISWSVRATIAGRRDTDAYGLDADSLADLADVARRACSRLHEFEPAAAKSSSMMATILTLHESGAVCPVVLSARTLEILRALNTSSIHVVETLNEGVIYSLNDPFSFAPQAFPTQVGFNLTIVSFHHNLGEIKQAVGLPDYPAFCRERECEAGGRVISPARWRMRPVFDAERGPDTECWTTESVAAVKSVWHRLSSAGLDSAQIEVGVWPEIRPSQPMCNVLIPRALAELAQTVPLEIRVCFTGLRFGSRGV